MTSTSLHSRQSGRKLFLHMGAPKTGSSMLQAFLARNLDELARLGIGYPALEPIDDALRDEATSGNGAQLARAFLTERHPAHLPEAERARAIEALEICLSTTCGDLLISSEWFFVIPKPGLIQFDRIVAKHGVRIVPILYFRRQDHMVQSVYAQNVKRGGLTEEAMVFCPRYLERDRKLNYFAVMQGLSERFGKENCIFRIYEPEQWQGQSLTADFLLACGVADCSGFVEPMGQINVTPGRQVLEGMRRGNARVAASPFAERLLQKVAAWNRVDASDAAPILPPAMRRAFVDRFAASNARAAREFFGRADGVLFREPLPDPAEDWQPIPNLPVNRAARAVSAVILTLDRWITGGGDQPRPT